MQSFHHASIPASSGRRSMPELSVRILPFKRYQDKGKRLPRVVGFFIEDGVNKLGIDLFAGHYHTYDCDGKDHILIRDKKFVGHYVCDLFGLSPIGNAAFLLNASLTVLRKPTEVTGIFYDNFQELRMKTRNEMRIFTIETDNQSTRKAFPRAIYRLKNPEDASNGNPPEISFFTENNVPSVAMEIDKFYFSYTCDRERHFHYENKKLMVSYQCGSWVFLGSPQLLLMADIRQPRTEVYSYVLVFGRELTFFHSVNWEKTRELEYKTTSDGVAEWPFKPFSARNSEIFPKLVLFAQGTPPEQFPDGVASVTDPQGVGFLTFYMNKKTFKMQCDGRKRQVTAIALKSRGSNTPPATYTCTAKKDEKQRITKVEISIAQSIYSIKYNGTFSFDDESLTLTSGEDSVKYTQNIFGFN